MAVSDSGVAVDESDVTVDDSVVAVDYFCVICGEGADLIFFDNSVVSLFVCPQDHLVLVKQCTKCVLDVVYIISVLRLQILKKYLQISK